LIEQQTGLGTQLKSKKKRVAKKSQPHPERALHGRSRTVPDLSRYFPAAEAIAELLRPHAEVVIHDLTNDRIVAIWNAFSNRKKGDPSNLANDEELTLGKSVLGPYEKATPNGDRIKSVSAALADDEGVPGLLCINFDMSKFDEAISLLKAFASPLKGMPKVLFKNDLREQVNLIIREQLMRMNKRITALDRNDRVTVIRQLDLAHVFETRNAVPLVATAFGISRATLYNLLAEARTSSADGSD